MKRGQLAILALAVAAVAAMAYWGSERRGGGDGGGGRPPTAAPPANAIRVPFAYSPEKQVLLEPLIERFNASRTGVAGRPVYVEGRVIASGDAESRIAAGRLKPVAWSPASSLWGRLLNFEADRQLAPEENPSIVRTPLVISMWEPMARALGYPQRPVGFSDILRLARDPRGWAAVGRPEFGAFKLVHTNPDFSTSGLSAVVAEYYAATGKKEGLREEDITGRARATVRAIERSIVHYGDTTLFIADQMRRHGPGYASAVAMEEATLLEFNGNRAGQPKLVAVYPEEGTFFSDNPFMVLAGEWVSRQERDGAETFRRYLDAEITPEVAAEAGFRPADLDEKPGERIRAANGVDPSQPERVLALPEPRVLARIKDAWRQDRKPANVLLVVDTSGSMTEANRLENAKDGLHAFLSHVAPQDHVGLTAFSDKLLPLVPVEPFKDNRAVLEGTVDALIAGGGTAVYDATAEGFEAVQGLAGREDRINAVVVLTDGQDTDSRRDVDDVVEQLRGQGDSATQVRVFTIAYSPDALGAEEALERIATASGGKSYTGDTDDIESVYRSISSFF